MLNVSMKTKINASADEVWKTISDFNGLPKFVPALAKSTVEGSGVGAVRKLILKDGGPPIVERLESQDEAARTLSYSILDSPLPVGDYVAVMEVQSVKGEQCELNWSATFNAKGASDAEAKKTIEGIFSGGFDGLKKLYAVG